MLWNTGFWKTSIWNVYFRRGLTCVFYLWRTRPMAACCWHSAGNIAVLNLGTEPGISTTEGSKHGHSCAHMCPFLCTTVLLHLFAQLIQLKKPVEDYLVPDAFVKFPPTLVKQLWSPRGHENRAGRTGNAQAGRSLNFPCQKWWAAPSAQPVLCHSTSGHCAAVMPASTPEAYIILMSFHFLVGF